MQSIIRIRAYKDEINKSYFQKELGTYKPTDLMKRKDE